MLLQKSIDAFRSVFQGNKIIIFIDDSSENSFDRGGADILFCHSSGADMELKVPANHIASNFTCELITIKKALSFYHYRYSDDSVVCLVVFSDSISALETMRNGETNLIQSINSFLSKSNKSCNLQWILTHEGIEGNECPDIYSNEARILDQSLTVTSGVANEIGKRKILISVLKCF